MTDWLIKKAFDAISSKRPELSGWCEERLKSWGDRDRLSSLSYICTQLDAENLQIVADELGVRFDDLKACARVLPNI